MQYNSQPKWAKPVKPVQGLGIGAVREGVKQLPERDRLEWEKEGLLARIISGNSTYQHRIRLREVEAALKECEVGHRTSTQPAENPVSQLRR